MDLKWSHSSWKLSSHCHETIAERYHWWVLVNRQAYKVGESLNQIQLCHLVQSRKLQVEHNKELLVFTYIMYNVQDYSILYNKVVRPVTCEGWHFTHNCTNNYTCMTPSFHLEGRVWAHKTSLTLSFFIEVPVPSQESRQPYICVRCVDFASIYSVQDIWKIDTNCVWFVHNKVGWLKPSPVLTIPVNTICVSAKGRTLAMGE